MAGVKLIALCYLIAQVSSRLTRCPAGFYGRGIEFGENKTCTSGSGKPQKASFKRIAAKDWDEAKRKCEEEEKATLAVIQTSAQNEDATQACGDGNDCFIGLKYSTTSKMWGWVDGSALDYTNWGDGQPQDNDEHYGKTRDRGKWHDYPVDAGKDYAVCGGVCPEIVLAINCTACPEGEFSLSGFEGRCCPNGEFVSIPNATECQPCPGGHYGILAKHSSTGDPGQFQRIDAADWKKAKTKCEEQDPPMQLAVIQSQRDNDQVASACGDGNDCFIGLKYYTSSKVWGWVDGSALDYTNWADGQPQDNDEHYGKTRDMGKWHDYSVDAGKDYAVCGPSSSDGEEFKLEKQCSKCETDTFSAAEGALDGNVCKKCDAGYAAEPGSTACWAWWQIFAWLFGVGLVVLLLLDLRYGVANLLPI